MKFFLPVLFVAFFLSAGCKNQKQTSGKDVSEEEKKEQAVQYTSNDSAEIRTVIIDFYTWYNKNYAQFMEYDLYDGIKKKDAPPYKINWSEVERYQSFIRTSVPQLGEEFIRNQKHFFQQCDSAFKKDTEDDIPYGFDYDWYTNSQEDPQYLLDEITKGINWWEIVVNGNDAAVVIKGYHDHKGKQDPVTFISLDMKKENGKWKIAKIGND